MKTKRERIYEVLLAFASEHGGNSPSLRGLWREYQKREGCTMAWGIFLRHVNLLEKQGRIQHRDGEIVICHAPWAELADREREKLASGRRRDSKPGKPTSRTRSRGM